jgi:hypothetical protein
MPSAELDSRKITLNGVLLNINGSPLLLRKGPRSLYLQRVLIDKIQIWSRDQPLFVVEEWITNVKKPSAKFRGSAISIERKHANNVYYIGSQLGILT